MSDRPLKKPINLKDFDSARRTDLYLPLYRDAMGLPLSIPFIVVRGATSGPTLGLTAAVHGDELNGIRIIQNLLAGLNPANISGALICAPIVNVPSYMEGTRFFSDGLDLNNVFPGKAHGKPAEQYARAFCDVFLPSIDYLIDLHTASQGRTNSIYVRVDAKLKKAREIAAALDPEIILHVPGRDGTLRWAARVKKIPAVTLEVGNPSTIQGRMVVEGEASLVNAMKQLGMLKGSPKKCRKPVVCRSSKWLRTTGGGIIETHFKLRDQVKKKQLLAQTRDPFGNILHEYYAPTDGIVIGMAANPIAIPGMRFCHLGKVGAI